MPLAIRLAEPRPVPARPRFPPSPCTEAIGSRLYACSCAASQPPQISPSLLPGRVSPRPWAAKFLPPSKFLQLVVCSARPSSNRIAGKAVTERRLRNVEPLMDLATRFLSRGSDPDNGTFPVVFSALRCPAETDAAVLSRYSAILRFFRSGAISLSLGPPDTARRAAKEYCKSCRGRRESGSLRWTSISRSNTSRKKIWRSTMAAPPVILPPHPPEVSPPSS